MKKLFFALLASAAVCANAQEVTLDFTENSWGLPVSSGNGLTETLDYTDGTTTITLSATTKYYYNATDKYLMLGKANSTLTLQAFDFDVAKIEVVGTSGASAQVKQNIFVGEDAVSTETTGAKDVTNVYEIAPEYQAAGNQYTLKVTSAHNTQITKIMVYKADATETPVLTTDLDNVYFWNYTTTAWSDYQVNEQTIHINAQNLTENVSYYMLSSGKTNGSYLENNVRFTVGNKNQYETNSGNIFVRVTSKVMGTYEDVLVVKSGDLIVEVPVCLKVAGTEGDGYWDANDFCPLTVADANLIHAVIPAGHSYMTEPTHAFAQDDNGERFFKGVVAEVTEISAKQEDGTGYGNATFVLKDELTAEETLTVFRAKGFDNALITDSEILKEGDTVVVAGDICDYNGTTELKSCYLYSVEPGTTTAISTVAAPVSEAHYNLQGQRVEGQHGFSVKAGKVIYTK